MPKKSVYVKGYMYVRKGKKIKVKPHNRKKPSFDPIIKDQVFDWREEKSIYDYARKQHKKGFRVFNMRLDDN